MTESKNILVAPLNWGLGHATRCIPIIKALINHKFNPILASDGAALQLLQKEFPKLTYLELPAYNITYAKKAKYFKYKLLKDAPKILKTISVEKKVTNKIIADYHINGIISDNRFGVYAPEIPSVFITHQLQVLSGNTTWFSTKIHKKIINKFDECWVPDASGTKNLSGKLGHVETPLTNLKYIGPLSRFETKNTPIKYDILVLLSGPEPQRSYLETLLFKELTTFKGSVLFVKGLVENEIKKEVINSITVYNYLTSSLLEDAINQSDLVISRSGYTTIMDLVKLEKKAFFIPTPGQFEQEYLAERLHYLGMTPFCTQEEFRLDKLQEVSKFKGLQELNYELNYNKLFSLFHAK